MMRVTTWMRRIAGGLVLATCVSGPAAAAEWGTIEGQILFDGDAPSLTPRVKKGDAAAKDSAVCAAEEVPDETVVINPESKGVANVVVYLRKAPADVHPDLKASAEKEVEFDQKGCRFAPHVLAVRTDQTVRCISQDAVPHNVRTAPLKNTAQNFVVAANDAKGQAVEVPQAETFPFPVKCDIHQWMEAYWIVTDHPYVAVTDADGKFKIENLPVGVHKFAVWQEKCGFVERNFEVTVKAGANSLPPLKVDAKKLKLN